MEHLDSAGGTDREDVTPVAVSEGPRSGRPVRRSFSAEDKRRIVAEYEATPRGQKGAMLRRARLYDSHITEWRAAIAAGTLDAGPKRGRPKGSTRSPVDSRIAELERRAPGCVPSSGRRTRPWLPGTTPWRYWD